MLYIFIEDKKITPQIWNEIYNKYLVTPNKKTSKDTEIFISNMKSNDFNAETKYLIASQFCKKNTCTMADILKEYIQIQPQNSEQTIPFSTDNKIPRSIWEKILDEYRKTLFKLRNEVTEKFIRLMNDLNCDELKRYSIANDFCNQNTGAMVNILKKHIKFEPQPKEKNKSFLSNFSISGFSNFFHEGQDVISINKKNPVHNESKNNSNLNSVTISQNTNSMFSCNNSNDTKTVENKPNTKIKFTTLQECHLYIDRDALLAKNLWEQIKTDENYPWTPLALYHVLLFILGDIRKNRKSQNQFDAIDNVAMFAIWFNYYTNKFTPRPEKTTAEESISHFAILLYLIVISLKHIAILEKPTFRLLYNHVYKFLKQLGSVDNLFKDINEIPTYLEYFASDNESFEPYNFCKISAAFLSSLNNFLTDREIKLIPQIANLFVPEKERAEKEVNKPNSRNQFYFLSHFIYTWQSKITNRDEYIGSTLDNWRVNNSKSILGYNYGVFNLFLTLFPSTQYETIEIPTLILHSCDLL